DVMRRLAFGGEEGLEAGRKIGGARVETDRHGSCRAKATGRARPARFCEVSDDPARQARQPRCSTAWPRCAGQMEVGHIGPRSTNSTSRHSTSRRKAAPPENISVTVPDGHSLSSKVTASRLSTASGLLRSTLRHLTPMTRSK